MPAFPDCIRVAVVYARPGGAELREVRVECPASIRAAIVASGLLEAFPEIDLEGANRVGVFGRLAAPDTLLRNGDRVEIYRPLTANPREARRARAVKATKGSRGKS